MKTKTTIVTGKPTKFEYLEIGEVFEYQGIHYLKVAEYDALDVESWDNEDVRTWGEQEFTEVYIKEAELVIKY